MMCLEVQRQRFFQGIVPRRRSIRQINPDAVAASQAEADCLRGLDDPSTGLDVA